MGTSTLMPSLALHVNSTLACFGGTVMGKGEIFESKIEERKERSVA